jgi:hypothetical protein
MPVSNETVKLGFVAGAFTAAAELRARNQISRQSPKMKRSFETFL